MQFEGGSGQALHYPEKGSIEHEDYAASDTSITLEDDEEEYVDEIRSCMFQKRYDDPVMFHSIIRGNDMRCECVHLSPPKGPFHPGEVTYVGGIEASRRFLCYVQ